MSVVLRWPLLLTTSGRRGSSNQFSLDQIVHTSGSIYISHLFHQDHCLCTCCADSRVFNNEDWLMSTLQCFLIDCSGPLIGCILSGGCSSVIQKFSHFVLNPICTFTCHQARLSNIWSVVFFRHLTRSPSHWSFPRNIYVFISVCMCVSIYQLSM